MPHQSQAVPVVISFNSHRSTPRHLDSILPSQIKGPPIFHDWEIVPIKDAPNLDVGRPPNFCLLLERHRLFNEAVGVHTGSYRHELRPLGIHPEGPEVKAGALLVLADDQHPSTLRWR